MWAGYLLRGWGHNDSSYQTSVWNYASQYQWTAPCFNSADVCIRGDKLGELASHFLSYTVTRVQYLRSEGRQYLADVEKAVDLGDPSIVAADYGSHVMMFVGASWHLINSAQPSQDYIVVHDPAPNYTPFWTYTISTWLISGASPASVMLRRDDEVLQRRRGTAVGGLREPRRNLLRGSQPPAPSSDLSDAARLGGPGMQQLQRVGPTYMPTPAECYNHCVANGAKPVNGRRTAEDAGSSTVPAARH